jgi:hypothetical protein
VTFSSHPLILATYLLVAGFPTTRRYNSMTWVSISWAELSYLLKTYRSKMSCKIDRCRRCSAKRLALTTPQADATSSSCPLSYQNIHHGIPSHPTIKMPTPQSQWLFYAISSGACASLNGVFAKLTTTHLTTSWATGLSHFFGMKDESMVIEVIVRGVSGCVMPANSFT